MASASNASPVAYALLQRLSRGMQMFLLAACAALAILMQWWASTLKTGGVKDFLDAVATGLLVSAAFGVAQALVTGRITTELLRASVITEVNRSLSATNQEFFPTHDFAQSTTPDPVFNLLINEDLRNSSVFWFRGLSARYTAARLAQNRSPNLQVHLIIPDPTVPTSIDGRLDYEIRQELNPGLSPEEVREKIKRDIAVGIVGLYEARHRCASIQLVLTPVPLLDRYEIFRDAIWVTLFSDRNQGTKFPRTLRYGNSSVLYKMHETECLQTRRHSTSRTIELARDADLAAFFRTVFGRDAEPGELADLQDEMKSFAAGFLKESGVTGGR